MRKKHKLKLAVWKFASCDGCQLSLLDCEDELLAIAGEIEIAHFPEASGKIVKGPYDISLVEGSITREEDILLIKKIRKQSKFLVTIGACAASGGIQALKNFKDVKDFISIVYATPEFIDSMAESLPISHFIPVEFELRGCPINKYQLLELINAFLNRRKPNIPTYSVCIECKRKGIVCVAVTKKMFCLGPVTQAGCGALCPSYRRGCFGCYGPKETPNAKTLGSWWKDAGMKSEDLVRAFRGFNAFADTFKEESERHEK